MSGLDDLGIDRETTGKTSVVVWSSAVLLEREDLKYKREHSWKSVDNRPDYASEPTPNPQTPARI